MEVWAPVKGLEKFYEVSDLGRVRSITRMVRVRSGERLLKGRILKARAHPFGYPMVTMSAENKRYHRTVHSLVAEAFLGPRPDGFHVCHKDGRVWNCTLDNLRYDTPGGNSMDRLDHGTFQMGEEIHSAVLTEKDVVKIRERRAAGDTLAEIARDFDQSEVNICKIVTGVKWKRASGPITRRNRKQKLLNEAQRCEARVRRRAGETYASLARAFGVSETQIKNVVKNEDR